MSDFNPDLNPENSPLNAEGRRNVIRATISQFTTRGISATEALGVYKSQGLGINESDFYALYRQVLGIEVRANRVNSVNSNLIPSDKVFAEKEYNQKQRYRFDIMSQVYNPETGDKREEVRTVYRSSLDTMANMRSGFEEYFSNYGGWEDLQVGSVHILGAYIDEEIL